MAKFVFFCLCISAICVLFTYGKNLRPNHQQLIDSLRQYEFIEPRLSEPFIVQSAENVPVEEKRFLSFYFQGHFINILLTVNRNLLSPNFFIRHVTDHGQEIINEVPRNCFFHGYVVGQEDTSIASISSCDGIEGYFTLNDTTFSVEPVESLNGEVFNIVFESEHRNSSKYKGYLKNTDVHGIDLENTRETKHRTRRNVFSETKYVELLVVNDASQYKRYSSKTSTRAIAAANHADSTFRVQNIRVILIMIEIWKDADQIDNSTTNSKFLSNFIEYKKKVLDINETTQSDHAMLITQKPLENGRHGWARIATICTPNSASLLYDSSDTSLSGSIMAHELGHSFGFYHINSAECPCGDDNVHKCLMNADVTYSPLKWSNCTLAALRNILEDDRGTCLFNLPKNHYMSAVCGNGLIDKGEECDCGTEQECERWGGGCCNQKTCKLHPGKECDSGACCENCTIRSEGSLCREKVNDCDLPEFCDGKSPICAAADSYVHDGRTCHVGQEKSICYLGVCHSYDKQCEEYWGEKDAFYSKFCSNNLNDLDNSKLGFCKLLDDEKYMKCKEKDVLCGKLQCMMKNNPTTSRTPINGGRGLSANFGSLGVCWSGELNLDNVNDGGMVSAGAMCGENKVCFDNTCLNVNEVYGQNECPNNCSGNGICNQHGHCHCSPGYGCPNCSEKCDSEGGSIDSGNNCYCPGPTTTPKTTEVTEPTLPQTTEATEPTLPQTTGPEANRTTEPVATSRTPAGPTTTPKTIEVTEPTLPQTTEVTEPTLPQTTGPEANRTTEPVATNRTAAGIKDRSDVVVIVVPVVLVIVIIIVIVIFIFYRQQILGCVENFRSSSLQKTKSENYRVSYSSKENLADSNTPQVVRENPYENTLQFTSVSFVSDSKIA